jgi:hypothetical protein
VAGVKYMTSVFRNMERRMLKISSVSVNIPVVILRVNIFWEEGKKPSYINLRVLGENPLQCHFVHHGSHMS